MSDSIKVYRTKATYLDRDYQSYSLQAQINLSPVDDDEETRLREQHALLLDVFRDRKSPLVPDSVGDPESILDCGYGAGDWAYEVAEQFPDCEVLAVDISPIMELGDMPENLNQEITDLNDPFVFDSASFDFVHSRFVAAGIAHSRWPSYLTDIKRVLKNAGWVQLTEWDLTFRSDNGHGERLSSLHRWTDVYLTALTKSTGSARKSRTVPESLETMLRTSGFINVQVDVREVPTCGWPSLARHRRVGEQNEANMQRLIKSAGLYPVTSRDVMSAVEFDDLVASATSELSDHEAQPYVRLYTVYGQKAA